MIRNIPKMTLKVELIGNTEATIYLLYVSDMFINNKNSIKTSNNWEYKTGSMFSINLYNGTVIIPVLPDIDIDLINFKFTSDRTRQILLKDFNDSLLQWSSDHFFRSNKIFNVKPHIKFNGKLWVIF